MSRNGPSRSRLAVVGILPPEKSGIAHFNLKAFADFPIPIDFFTNLSDGANRHACRAAMNVRTGNVSLRPHVAFAQAVAANTYEAVAFVLGNSIHNAFVARLLKTVPLHSSTKTILHLHDIRSDSLLYVSLDRDMREMWPLVASSYGLEWLMSVQGDVERCRMLLELYGWLGLRPLLQLFRADKILVNSAFAKDLALYEAGDFLPGERIVPLFHPVFAADGHSRSPHPGGHLSLGTFGGPSSDKRTDLVVQSWRRLKSRGIVSSLRIVGYGAADYANAVGLVAEDGLTVIDSPTSDDLLAHMSAVDVAIQLRLHAHGESSRIVAQLLSVQCPTIVTDCGAFREFGDACLRTPPGSSVDAICDAIIAAARSTSLAAPMRNYVRDHSVPEFQRRFMEECLG